MTGNAGAIAAAGRILLPGLVLQSVVVGGAYGTGREVVQWITSAGPRGGLAAVGAMAIATALVLFLSYDLARRFAAHEYRGFFRILLGRSWWLYEVFFLLGLVLVLSVAAAAAGEIIASTLGWPPAIGVMLMLTIIMVLNYLGRRWVDGSLAAWGSIMSLLLLSLLAAVLLNHGDAIASTFTASENPDSEAVAGGLLFFLYTVFIVPPTLYAAAGLRTRGECLAASLCGGVLVILPALAYHLAFLWHYPQILEQPLPTYWLLQQLGRPWIMPVYTVILFITIAQTGVGVLQGVNERLDNWWRERRGVALSRYLHAAVAALAVLASLLLAQLGVVALVARGYGGIAWISLLLFVLPLALAAVRLFRVPV